MSVPEAAAVARRKVAYKMIVCFYGDLAIDW